MFCRSFIDIDPERGPKESQEMVQSKEGDKMVKKKVVTVNTHVSTLMLKLSDFKGNFV